METQKLKSNIKSVSQNLSPLCRRLVS